MTRDAATVIHDEILPKQNHIHGAVQAAETRATPYVAHTYSDRMLRVPDNPHHACPTPG